MSTPDVLEIINGPEDGTEFPINRAPVIVGSDLDCAVNVRLDESVQHHHARLTAVGDGYRVRKLRGGHLAVDGKQAGMIRSRVLREGNVLQVGNTELYLRCAPDGLAKRSRGLPMESDLAWCVRLLFGKLWGLLWWFGNRSGRRSRFWRFLLAAFVIALVAGYLRPGLLAQVRYTLLQFWAQFAQQLMAYVNSVL